MPTLLHKLPECLAYRCALSYLPIAHFCLVYLRNRQFYLGSLPSVWSYSSLFYILILSLRCLFSNKRQKGDVSWWEGRWGRTGSRGRGNCNQNIFNEKKNLMFNLEEKERNKHFRLGIALFPAPRRQRPAWAMYKSSRLAVATSREGKE